MFLVTYLPYSYGRGDPGRIRAAAAPLRRELRAAPPRVPATVSSGRPRVISVRAQAATGSERVHVLALVADGRRRYAVSLEVRRFASGWLVTAVGG